MSDRTGLYCPGECGEELRIVSRWSDRSGIPHAIAACPCGDGYASDLSGDSIPGVPTRRDLDELITTFEQRGAVTPEQLNNWIPYIDLDSMFELLGWEGNTPPRDPAAARRSLQRRAREDPRAAMLALHDRRWDGMMDELRGRYAGA